MAYYFVTSILFLVVWGVASLMSLHSEFSLFESYVIFVLALLLCAEVKKVVEK